MRYMLVDGHGNFGSVDGDPPAAYRYTEARLAKIADEMLRDIEKDTVDWDPNFDESRKEPRVLPCRFPNLLVNGSSGIAVGMATNIPPHNLREVIGACICVLDNPEATLADLMEHIKGPGLPHQAASSWAAAGIRAAYATGRGRVVVRARHEFEEFGNDRTRIIITEIPYQVNKRMLIKNMADQVEDKRLEGISDIRDEIRPQRYAHRHRAEAGRQSPGGAQPPVCPDPAANHLRHQYAGPGAEPVPAEDSLPAAHHRRVSGLPGGDHRPPHQIRPEEGPGAGPSAGGSADRPGQHRRGHPYHPHQL